MVSAGRRESIFIYWVISWVRFPPLFLPYFFIPISIILSSQFSSISLNLFGKYSIAFPQKIKRDNEPFHSKCYDYSPKGYFIEILFCLY